MISTVAITMGKMTYLWSLFRALCDCKTFNPGCLARILRIEEYVSEDACILSLAHYPGDFTA